MIVEEIIEAVALEATEVEREPWRAMPHSVGVEHRVLWEDPKTRSYAGVMRLLPWAVVPTHTHSHAVHHVWIHEGSCEGEGKELGPGSYSYVPKGAEHGVRAGAEGCTFFYLYLAEPKA